MKSVPGHALSVGLAVFAATTPSLAASLCSPKNACVDGVGQYNGSVCRTVEAFQGLNDSFLKSHATDFAGMSRYVEDPRQLVGIHNSCCTGLMQVNVSNLHNPDICGCEASEYATYTPQQQIDVYQLYLHTFDNNFGMDQLKQMITNHQSLGGHQVDSYTLVACAQMGTGNCDAAVRNKCSSLAVGSGGDNHVNVCTMADEARDRASNGDELISCGN